MYSYCTHCIIIFICVILYIMYQQGPTAEEELLLIGILSAPQNFELRETIRKTWLQYIGRDIKYYFLIGEHMCGIPKEDRIDEYACEELPIYLPAGNGHADVVHYLVQSVSDSNDTHMLQSGSFVCRDESVNVPLYAGYTFTTQHDIVIRRIGLVNGVSTHTVRVSLLEAATGFKITSATFLHDGVSNTSSIVWKPVESYRLPRGFEGKIVLESNMQSLHGHQNCGFDWNSSGNILAYHLFWSPNGKRVQFHNSSLTSIAVAFELPDIDSLKEFLSQKAERKKLWDKSISSINHRIKEEVQTMGDILFLDVVDVYRSLAKKMLKFYEWADHNMKFLYLLKTDDDTFINIPLIQKYLHSLSAKDKESPTRMWWWSDFREVWPIQFAGKWRETAYRSVTYPPFPCGAGFILSREIVKFLSGVADKLYTEYQGEDVALGIWLASINPHSIQNQTPCFWTCDISSATEYSCNYPQLSAEQMLQIYQEHKNV